MLESTCLSRLRYGYWTKLDMPPSAPTNREAVDDFDSHLTEEIEMINQCFSVSNNSEKIILLKRLRELVIPTTSSRTEPEVNIRNAISTFQS